MFLNYILCLIFKLKLYFSHKRNLKITNEIFFQKSLNENFCCMPLDKKLIIECFWGIFCVTGVKFSKQTLHNIAKNLINFGINKGISE